jgi:hypothetical protein
MTLPYVWRITKYDPTLRNMHGNYLGNDWTSFSDIGKFYAGKQVTYEDYLSWESAYAYSVLYFLSEAGLSSLCVVELENRFINRIETDRLRDVAFEPTKLKLDTVVGSHELEDVTRLNLREVLWCKLERASHFYLHFGWDYYMYIGSTSPSCTAINQAQQKGLFVEAMASPYL